jgi:hypothetical protein
VRSTCLLTAALVGWMLLSPVAPASADIFVSPFLGLKFRGDSNELDLDREDGARDAKMSVGIAGVVVMDKGLGIELELAHQPRFFERKSNSVVTSSGVTTLGVNLLLAAPISITRESLRPYVVGGLGWMHASAQDLFGFAPVSNDFVGLTLGVGAVGFIGDVTGLRFDLRYLKSVSSSDVSDLSGDSARISFWRATVGVVFR